MRGDEVFFNLTGPIELSPGPGRTRAASLQMFGELVKELGGEPRSILERHDIDPARIADPEHHIECRSMVDAFQYCASYLDSPLFGFHLAGLQGPDVFGCVTTLCRAAPDLRTATQCFIDYLPVVHSPAYEMSVVECDRSVELRWFRHSEDYEGYDQVNHHALLRVVNLFRSLMPQNLRLNYANISTSIPQGARDEMEAKVGCPVHDRQGIDSIGFSPFAFSSPLMTSNKLVYQLLGAYLQKVKAAEQMSLCDRVEAYVRGAIPSGNCTLPRCADKLGISARTLQHQLRSADVSFSEIVTKQRMELARTYLAEGALSVTEIALMLGYAEQTSFGRAFKKWTGASPSHFRR
ncbi:helix-turn-helix domain-containing protein [Phenylobacterium sp. LjRoot225]|uniref:AraC family transcriptional regulator n=1 Tax=Phenylobacterium sp. LjRoot225 TaxID=3342285 RepID=UPI003ECDAD95